jgi:hypothetical protein
VIDRLQFAKVMGVFADRLGRALAPATAEEYYLALSLALTTEEFVAGARVVFRTHQYNTWPAPIQFIRAANPLPENNLLAAEAFEAALEIMSDSRVPMLTRKAQVDALGPATARAFRAAGGVRDFQLVLLDQIPWLRNRFVEAYEAAASDESKAEHALSAGVPHATLDPRVGAMVKQLAGQYSRPEARHE